MLILTAAALAAAQPAPAPQAPVAHPAGHSAGHASHGQGQHGQTCPCCDHGGSTADRDCCAGHRQQQQDRGHDGHR